MELFRQKSEEENREIRVQMEKHKTKNLSLIREIALFNSTTLKPVYNHEKNTLPTKKVIGKSN